MRPCWDAVELGAWVAQPGDLDHRLSAGDVGSAPVGSASKVDAAGGDVLAHDAGRHREPGGDQRVMQLGMDEVDLPQIGLARVAPDAESGA